MGVPTFKPGCGFVFAGNDMSKGDAEGSKMRVSGLPRNVIGFLSVDRTSMPKPRAGSPTSLPALRGPERSL